MPTPSSAQPALPRVILAGCGYGAIDALRTLRGQARVLAINPYPYIVNSGMSTRLLSGRFSAELVRIPLLDHIAANGAEYLQGRVVRILPQENALQVQSEEGILTLGYEALLVNVGRQVRPIVGMEHAYGVRPIEQLAAARQQVERCWVRASAGDTTPGLLTFVVIGGGCTGVELMGELYDLCEDLSRRTGIPLERAQLVLISRNRDLVPGLSPRFSQLVAESLGHRRIQILAEQQVTAIHPDRVRIRQNGLERDLSAQVKLWAGGLMVPPWLSECGLPVGPDGSLRVDSTLRVQGSDNILAMGDCAHLELAPGQVLSKIGVYAVRCGPVAAQNLARLLLGQRLVSYQPQATVFVSVTVGKGLAVMQKGSFVARSTLAVFLKNGFDWLYMRSRKPTRWQEFFY